MRGGSVCERSGPLSAACTLGVVVVAVVWGGVGGVWWWWWRCGEVYTGGGGESMGVGRCGVHVCAWWWCECWVMVV